MMSSTESRLHMKSPSCCTCTRDKAPSGISEHTLSFDKVPACVSGCMLNSMWRRKSDRHECWLEYVRLVALAEQTNLSYIHNWKKERWGEGFRFGAKIVPYSPRSYLQYIFVIPKAFEAPHNCGVERVLEGRECIPQRRSRPFFFITRSRFEQIQEYQAL